MAPEAAVASPNWIEVSLCTPPELVEAISNFLIDEDSNGVVIEDLDADDAYRDRRQLGWLWIRAYFREEGFGDLEERLHTYLDELAALFPTSEPPVLDQRVPEVADWSQCWKRFFKPLMVSDRILVRPSWEDGSVPSGVAAISLDPGIAFGTGKHPSTRLCVRALEDEVLFPLDDAPAKNIFSMLDVGTGSGILSLVAARLGAPRTLGIDNDLQAVEAAQNNVRLNDLDKKVEISDERLDELGETFDVIMANIVADTLISMKDDLVNRLAPQGVLILSGLLRNQGAWIKHEFLQLPISFVNAHHEDEWCALVFEKI